jgi:hypothetical protein
MIDVLLYNLQQSMRRTQISYGIIIFHWKFCLFRWSPN